MTTEGSAIKFVYVDPYLNVSIKYFHLKIKYRIVSIGFLKPVSNSDNSSEE